MKTIVLLFGICLVVSSCKKKSLIEEEIPTIQVETKIYPDSVWTPTGSGPRLIFKFKFDSTQVRLNAFGNPISSIPAGHGGLSPVFNKMAAHYLELAQNDYTQLGAGKVLYHAPETTKGGSTAINFGYSIVVKEGAIFFSKAINEITPGTYQWLRLSLSYQNYDIPFLSNSLSGTQHATIASFLGYQTYVEKYKIKTQDYIPSASVGGPTSNHPQGYWGFETNYIVGYPNNNGHYMLDGQPPAGATTVVNPNFANSPIPAGSCVVTAKFTNDLGTTISPLIITGNETNDIIVTVSLSTNKSFEWLEVGVPDGYYKPDAGEKPIDMGVRGMLPKVQY